MDFSYLTDFEIWTKDKSGNFGVCNSYVNLGSPNCDPWWAFGSTPGISGTIARPPCMGGEKSGDVLIQLLNNNSSVVPNIFTGSNGAFGYAHLPIGLDLLLRPQKDIDLTAGVYTLDLVFIT